MRKFIGIFIGIALTIALIPSAAFASSGSFHIQVTSLSPYGFDVESGTVLSLSDPAVDVSMGSHYISGYRQLVARNGAGVALVGYDSSLNWWGYDPPAGTYTPVDYASVDWDDAQAATYSAEVNTSVYGAVPWPGTVFIVATADGNYAKIVVTYIDFTRPNGLKFNYETLVDEGPDSGGAILRDSGIPGKGLDTAPGLQKPFNPKSQAAQHAGKKK